MSRARSRSIVFIPPPGSPTPYAFERIPVDSQGKELARLEAQNRLFDRQGPLDLLPPVPDRGRILDVGSGTGYWAVRLADKVPHGQVVCLDRSPELLAHARARLEQAGRSDAEYLHQDLRNLDLPEASFDLVFTCMTLVHVAELEATLRQLIRALRPGGWIACFEPIHEPRGLFEAYPPCENLDFLVDQLQACVQQQGSDLSAGLKIAHLLDHLGMDETGLRYFGAAPHGEDLRIWLEDIILPIARSYLVAWFQPDHLDRRIRAALEEALRPGTWINLRRTLVLGRKRPPIPSPAPLPRPSSRHSGSG